MSDQTQPPVPEGIVVPLHTPFDRDSRLDEAGISAEIEQAESHGASWILIGGVTGEWPTLDSRERQQLLTTALAARRSSRILAHVEATDLRETTTQLEHAEAAGADAVMVSAPIVSAVSEEDAVAHVTRTAEKANLPVVVYNGAPGSSQPFSANAIAQLSRVSNIAGIKDSGRDPRAFAEARALVDPSCRLLCGEGDLLPSWLALGADGGIVVPALVDTRRTLDLYDAHIRSDLQTFRSIWNELWPLIALLGTDRRFLPMTKLAVSLQGRPAGTCRPPLAVEVSASARQALTETLVRLDLVTEPLAVAG
jgi:4-hydroxy-tetrahydrodipicolinate synthase